MTNMSYICNICTEVFLPSSDQIACPCGHVFHLECLQQWFERSKTCPQCRKPIREKQCVKLFLSLAEESLYQHDKSRASVARKDTGELEKKIEALNQEAEELHTQMEYIVARSTNTQRENDRLAYKIQQVKIEKTSLKNENAVLKAELRMRDNEWQEAMERIKCLNKKIFKLEHGDDQLQYPTVPSHQALNHMEEKQGGLWEQRVVSPCIGTTKLQPAAANKIRGKGKINPLWVIDAFSSSDEDLVPNSKVNSVHKKAKVLRGPPTKKVSNATTYTRSRYALRGQDSGEGNRHGV